MPADRSKTGTPPISENGDSGSDIQQAREEVIHDHLEVNKALAIDDAFSLAPAAMTENLSLNATAKNRNPEVRRAIFQRMLDNLSKLRRDSDELGIAFGKGYKRSAIEDTRKTASIRKEAAFRENFQQPPNTGLTWRNALNAHRNIV